MNAQRLRRSDNAEFAFDVRGAKWGGFVRNRLAWTGWAIAFETLAFCPRTRAKKRPPRPPAPAVGGAARQILEWF
jgi:hypothetical protein